MGIAADLVAQAEHDPEALALLITTNASLARQVADEVDRRVKTNAIARQAIERNGLAVIAGSLEEAHTLTNKLAPEHLTVDAEEDLAWVQNAGSVFIGRYSAQPMGDYVSGPNHTLPTGGVAQVRGGLSVMDYLKLITVQEYSLAGLRKLGRPPSPWRKPRDCMAMPRQCAPGGSMAEIVLQQTPLPRQAVRRMHAYHPPLAGRDGLRLDFNENTVACSPRVLEALSRVAAGDLARYPERGHVEAKVAEHLGLAAEQVLLTNGVDEAIHVLCQTYLDRDDEFLFRVPTYSMYEIYGSCTDATVRTVPSGADFAFPLDELLAAIRPQTRLIAIASPNSPTGTIATRQQILKLLERAPQAVVLVDEAYYHFCGEDRAGPG